MPLHWDWKPDSTTCCNKESGRYYDLLPIRQHINNVHSPCYKHRYKKYTCYMA